MQLPDLARSIEDLRLGLSLIEGPDGRQWSVPRGFRACARASVTEYRFAWTDNLVAVTAETRTVIEKLAVTLEQLGVAWSAATHQDLILPLHYRPSARFVEPRLARQLPFKALLLAIVLRTRSSSEPLVHGLVKCSCLCGM